MIDLTKISDAPIPLSCIHAVWLWRHPYQVIVESNDCLYVYDPEDKCFYYRNPNCKVYNNWRRAYGLDDWLRKAIRHFPDLCLEEPVNGGAQDD